MRTSPAENPSPSSFIDCAGFPCTRSFKYFHASRGHAIVSGLEEATHALLIDTIQDHGCAGTLRQPLCFRRSSAYFGFLVCDRYRGRHQLSTCSRKRRAMRTCFHAGLTIDQRRNDK